MTKRAKMGCGRRGRKAGGGIFDDIGQGFNDFGNFVNDGLKRSGIVSKALPFIGATAGTLLDPFLGPAGTALGGIVGSAAGDYAKSQGYGTKKGCGYLNVPSTLRSAHLPRKMLTTIQGGCTRVRGGAPVGVYGTISSDRGRAKF